MYGRSTDRWVVTAPAETPASVNPCIGEYCMTFTSNCQASNAQDAAAQGCAPGRKLSHKQLPLLVIH